MYYNCRPPSHHTIFFILQFSPFLTKCTLLAMCLVCLAYLPFLAIHTEDLLSNIIRGAASGTISGSLLKNNELISLKFIKPLLQYMLRCTRFLNLIEKLLLEHVCHGKLATLIKDNICSYTSDNVWKNCYTESEKFINWFSVLILSCINMSDKGASFISA